MLLDHGLLFEEADNGSKAVAAVKEHEPGYYQFILMDIEMPEIAAPARPRIGFSA